MNAARAAKLRTVWRVKTKERTTGVLLGKWNEINIFYVLSSPISTLLPRTVQHRPNSTALTVLRWK